MIIDSLSRAERYFKMHPEFPVAFNYLRSGIFKLGRLEIASTPLIAIGVESEGLGHKGSRLEVHRRYIDIQFVIQGNEEVGWKPLEKCGKPDKSFQEEKDIGFFLDNPLTWVPVSEGFFVIFFPEDAHAALEGVGLIRKTMIKVPV